MEELNGVYTEMWYIISNSTSRYESNVIFVSLIIKLLKTVSKPSKIYTLVLSFVYIFYLSLSIC